ncbi:hypothetical protein ACU686_20770 [Yinghuangia aomiensis]
MFDAGCMGGLCIHVRDDDGTASAWVWSDLTPVDAHDQDQAEARAATADLVASLWSAYLGVDVTAEDVTNLCRIGRRIVERYRAEVGQ